MISGLFLRTLSHKKYGKLTLMNDLIVIRPKQHIHGINSSIDFGCILVRRQSENGYIDHVFLIINVHSC